MIILAFRSEALPQAAGVPPIELPARGDFEAAFAGDSIVYSAATSDNTPQVFAVRSDYPEPQPVGPRGMTLLAVSAKGELAVLLDAHYLWYRLFTGTLARMTL